MQAHMNPQSDTPSSLRRQSSDLTVRGDTSTFIARRDRTQLGYGITDVGWVSQTILIIETTSA
jgi:hypothetical protein